MKQPVFGSARVLGDACCPAPARPPRPRGWRWSTRSIPIATMPGGWIFRSASTRHITPGPTRFRLAFDTMNILLDAICRAGLNRGEIRNALYGLERYRGVTGEMVFDPTPRTSPPCISASYTTASGPSGGTPCRTYATVGDAGVEYNGPAGTVTAGALRKIGLFGPGAAALAAGLAPGYEVVGISSEAAWGKASNELVKLVYDPTPSAWWPPIGRPRTWPSRSP